MNLPVNTLLAPDQAIADVDLALHLFIRTPLLFGGIILRGYGPVRDDMLAHAAAIIGRDAPVHKIPISIDAERLLGGLDLTATLATGRTVQRPGLLAQATGGVVIVSMAERVQADIAAHIAQSLDSGAIAAMVLDDACDADEAPPITLVDRAAFACDLSDAREFGGAARQWPDAIPIGAVASLSVDQRHAIAVTAAMLGIASVRALIFAQTTARAHAALYGRMAAEDADVAAAVRLVLAPRATQMPQSAPPPDAAPELEDSDSDSDTDEDRSVDDRDLEDILLDAAAAAIPPHILDQIDNPARGRGKGPMGRSGQKQKSAMRGRSLGSRPGIPGHGKKLALIDSLRAAAPYQSLRRQSARAGDMRTVHIRTSDLRVRRFEMRRESLTIFAVDASGSSALSRLAEAKGAVELMLAAAYVKRSQVALIAFRGSAAEVLLPPTRSLTRARRALTALPGGGGTPLAAGLIAAQHLAQVADRAGQTPTIAVLTDGKANVAIDGSANRTQAIDEMHAAAKSIAQMGIHSIVIDISPRPREEAAALAAALGGTYLALPRAHSAALVSAIEQVSAGAPA